MIEISELHFSYNSEKAVLEGLSATFSSNEIHGIMGANGAGKSTFFSLIKGYNAPDKGEIIINGESKNHQEIALMGTEQHFLPRMKAIEYLQFFKIQNPKFQLDQWNKIMDLPLNQFVSEYSTGMQKKLGIMSLIALDKSILLLDEPFNGLDAESYEKLKEILLHLKSKGKTILISSHIANSLTEISDDIHYLENGNFNSVFRKTEFYKMEELLFDKYKKEVKSILKDL